jgi:hypothetical protein
MIGDKSPPSQRVRTLPIRVAPVPGEAMDSWLEALAARSHATWGDLLRAVGLQGSGYDRLSARHHVMTLASDTLPAVALATGVGTEVLASMTMNAVIRGVVEQSARSSLLVMRTGSRFCPECLTSGGRWMSWWRLRWAFACPVHRCLLVDLCPRCGHPPRSRPVPASVVPTPGRCVHPVPGSVGGNAQRCGAELSKAAKHSLSDDVPALEAQQRILKAVTLGSVSDGLYHGHPVSAVQFLYDLRAVGMRAARYGSADELRTAALLSRDPASPLFGAADTLASTPIHSGLPSPTTAAQTAVAACVAMQVLSATSTDTAAGRLRWLVSSSRAHGFAVSASNIGWAKRISAPLTRAQLAALAPFLGHVDQIRYRCFSDTPRRPLRGPHVVHRSIPAMLWCPWILPVADSAVGFDQIRTALSVAAVIAGSTFKMANACSSVGMLTTPAAVSRVLRVLASRPDWEVIATMLAALADHLIAHPAPIDYQRRRHIPMGRLLSEPLWHSICRDLEMSPGNGVRVRLIRCWLYERITGSPGRLYKHAPRTGEFRAKLADLPRTMFPELVVALDDVARRFLDDHGLTGEPVRWEPPDDAVPGWLTRRPLDTVVDISRLHDLVRPRDRLLGAVAASLAVPIELVRETLNDHPADRLAGVSPHRRATGAATATARARLPKDELTDLVSRQGLSLQAIADTAGVSGQTIFRLAREYGITPLT